MIQQVKTVGGYLNFFVDRTLFSKEIVAEVLKNDRFGASDEGKGKTVVLDYSSPNIAKPFHIGHLPSTVLGNSLYRIYEYMGYKSVGINHLGDWGTQFGTMIVAYKRWGSKEAVEARCAGAGAPVCEISSRKRNRSHLSGTRQGRGLQS